MPDLKHLPYLTAQEIAEMEAYNEHAARDTVSCWIATRLNGASASMACDGNISRSFMKALDERLLPILKPNTPESESE